MNISELLTEFLNLGHHSVVGRPSVGGLAFAEYVVYRGEQAYPEFLITYQVWGGYSLTGVNALMSSGYL